MKKLLENWRKHINETAYRDLEEELEKVIENVPNQSFAIVLKLDIQILTHQIRKNVEEFKRYTTNTKKKTLEAMTAICLNTGST